jgi:hypothetical protein
MNRRILAILMLGLPAVLMLSGCVGPGAAGNEIGGAIPMEGITRQHASAIARFHCAKYGRSARILAIRSEDGQKAVFECKP